MKAEYIQRLPISEELRQELLIPRPRIKSRTPEAVARRRRYRLNKPKKSRIRCLHCNKRFTPKRSTKKFCGGVCRNKSNILEHKLFNILDTYAVLFKKPTEAR